MAERLQPISKCISAHCPSPIGILFGVREEWTFVISGFDRYTPCAIVLSDNHSDIEAVPEAVVADGNQDSLVEKW